MERFELINKSKAITIYDKLLKENIKDPEKICDLLNIYYLECKKNINEVNRLYNDLEELDIMLGELSWLVDERESPNDIDKIRKKSLELSDCITQILYPQVENNKFIYEY